MQRPIIRMYKPWRSVVRGFQFSQQIAQTKQQGTWLEGSTELTEDVHKIKTFLLSHFLSQSGELKCRHYWDQQQHVMAAVEKQLYSKDGRGDI